MKKWLIFIAVITLSLAYGLGLRERNATPAPRAKAESITPPLYTPLGDADSELVRREVVLMGSQFIFAVDAPRPQAIAAITAATERLRELEAAISSWKPGSDIYRLNDNAGHDIKVGADTLALLRLGKQIQSETGGAFDVSIGAVWDLYPFRNPDAPMPNEQQIAAQLENVGAQRIGIDEAASKARVPEGMKVNLGGIGKGYAAQLAITTMKGMGIENAAVSAGGDLYLMGGKQTGPWNVRIENPRWEGRSIEQFTLRDRSVATSGDGQRYIMVDGKRYGHIIDPRTGRPAEGSQSVTVICDDPSRADAYATAVFVMGPAEGMKWVDSHVGVEALIIDDNGTVSRSAGWASVTGNGS